VRHGRRRRIQPRKPRVRREENPLRSARVCRHESQVPRGGSKFRLPKLRGSSSDSRDEPKADAGSVFRSLAPVLPCAGCAFSVEVGSSLKLFSVPCRKSPAADEAAPKKLTTYTIKLDDPQMRKLQAACSARSWEPVTVAYAQFAFKGPGVNVTAYTSGKVVVAGKETRTSFRTSLETEITGEVKLGYDTVLHPEWFEAHAASTRAGKATFSDQSSRRRSWRTSRPSRRGLPPG